MMMIGFFLLTLNLVTAKEWALDDSTRTTIIAGVGSSDSSTVKGILAATANGVGAYVQNYDGNAWDNHPIQAAMLLDSAATFSGKTRVVVSTGKAYVSNDFGETFTPAANLVGTSQCAVIFGKERESIALVGGFALKSGDSVNATEAVVSTNGVAYSTDDGKTFSISTVPVGYTRYSCFVKLKTSFISNGFFYMLIIFSYGSFPTESTWYVSSGIWGDDPKTADKQHAFSSRLSIDSKGYLSMKEMTGEKKPLKGDGTPTGWFGAVSKTTDGGKTWTQVLSTNLETEYLYFNGISCATETQCVVVAEGDNPTGGYLTTAYTTFDGGGEKYPYFTMRYFSFNI